MYVFLILLIDIAAAVVWILILRKQDRAEKYKRRVHWIILFFLGGIASAFVSLATYGLNTFGLYMSDYGSEENPFLLHFYLVGPSEELAKLLVFIAISSLFRTVREPLDAAIQSATVGLGFGILENLLYGLDYGTGIALFRSVVCIVTHMSFTAVSGFAFGMTMYWHSLRREKTRIFIPFIGFMFALVLHGLYNFLLSTDVWFLSYVLSAGLGIALFRGFSRSSMISPYRLFPFSEWAKAVEYIDFGLKRDPDNPILNLRMGIYKAYSGVWPEALKYFEKAERLKPGSALFRAYTEAAKIELGRGGSAESLSQYFSKLSNKARKAFLSTMKTLSSKNAHHLSNLIQTLASHPEKTITAVREPVAAYGQATRAEFALGGTRKPKGI